MDLSQMFSINNSNTNGNSSADSDSDNEEDFNKLVEKAKADLVPEVSRRLYEKEYTKFQDWLLENKKNEINENILLAYFQKLSQSYAATSLWATYSKLKKMIILQKNINIAQYFQLQYFLKEKAKRHTVKKSKVFSCDEIAKFFNDAPDDDFLLHKVALSLGLHGCLRSKELLNITMPNIKEQGLLYDIQIYSSKTKTWRSFVTSEQIHPIISKYMKLRPEGMQRFLVQYRNKKCTHQNVGKGKLASIPHDIATFLNLPEPKKYTGHALRRTSATVLVDQGADEIMLKRHGGWKSSTVAQGYINESFSNKKNTSTLISNAMNVKQTGTVTSDLPQYAILVDKNVPSTSRIHLTQEEKEEIKNITQDEYNEVFQIEYPQKKNKLKRSAHSALVNEEIENISQEELEEVVCTQFFENEKKKLKPIYIFKNCNITINN